MPCDQNLIANRGGSPHSIISADHKQEGIKFIDLKKFVAAPHQCYVCGPPVFGMVPTSVLFVAAQCYVCGWLVPTSVLFTLVGTSHKRNTGRDLPGLLQNTGGDQLATPGWSPPVFVLDGPNCPPKKRQNATLTKNMLVIGWERVSSKHSKIRGS